MTLIFDLICYFTLFSLSSIWLLKGSKIFQNYLLVKKLIHLTLLIIFAESSFWKIYSQLARYRKRDEFSISRKIASGKAFSVFKQSFDSKFDRYFVLDEIDGLHLLHYGYDFYDNSTGYCGRKASSSLLQRSTHDLSYISKLYPFRLFGLLQFPDGPAQTKGWKSFQDLCRGFNDFCTGDSPLRLST